MSDLYAVLEVARDASDDDIKKSYRRLAMVYHPDRNAAEDAEARFKEIAEAYSILSDVEKRAHYDRFGSAPSSNGGFGQDLFARLFVVFNQADGFDGSGVEAVASKDLLGEVALLRREAKYVFGVMSQ